MNSQDIWTDWLEYRLNVPGQPPVQVLNNGIPGASIADALSYFRDKGRSLRPALVILCVHDNDVNDLLKPRPSRDEGLETERDLRFSNLRWFLGHHSALYDLAKDAKNWLSRHQVQQQNRSLVRGNSPPGVTTNPPFAVDPLLRVEDRPELYERYATLFGELASEVRRTSARLVVVYLPSVDNSISRRVAPFATSLAERHGLLFINLLPAIRSRPVEEVFLVRSDPTYPSDGHLSRTGHIVVANEIAQALREAGALRN